MIASESTMTGCLRRELFKNSTQNPRRTGNHLSGFFASHVSSRNNSRRILVPPSHLMFRRLSSTTSQTQARTKRRTDFQTSSTNTATESNCLRLRTDSPDLSTDAFAARPGSTTYGISDRLTKTRQPLLPPPDFPRPGLPLPSRCPAAQNDVSSTQPSRTCSIKASVRR